LKQLLKDGLTYVNAEPKTINWYAFQIDAQTFGIFDTFPDQDGLQQHSTGKLAEALMSAAPDLLAVPPVMEATEILAWK